MLGRPHLISGAQSPVIENLFTIATLSGPFIDSLSREPVMNKVCDEPLLIARDAPFPVELRK